MGIQFKENQKQKILESSCFMEETIIKKAIETSQNKINKSKSSSMGNFT